MADARTFEPRTARQERLLKELRQSVEPLTGAQLAQLCGVTRQVVVHDMALLRASGLPIVSTPRGYVIQAHASGLHRGLLAVSHPPELTKTELFILVDFGIQTLDVFVEHPIYGELRGNLLLSSRRDVQVFLEQVEAHQAPLLSSLTDGYHFHTVEYAVRERFREALTKLQEHGIVVHNQES